MNTRASHSHGRITVPGVAAGFALAVSFLTASCQSPLPSRIQESREQFQSLDPVSRKVIQAGIVDYGYSSELVTTYLGQPNSVAVLATVEGPVEIWTYRNFLYASPTATNRSMTHSTTRLQGGPLLSPGTPDGPSLDSIGTSPPPEFSDTSEMPIGTLVLKLFEGHVAAIRIDP